MAISRIKFSSLHSAKKSAPLILGESENGSSSEMLRVSDANYFSTRAPYLNAISVVCAKRALAPVCAGNGLYRRIQEAVRLPDNDLIEKVCFGCTCFPVLS